MYDNVYGILLLVFAATAVIAYMIGRIVRARARRRALIRSLRREAGGASAQRATERERPWLARFGRRLSKEREYDATTRLKLARAGWDSRTAPLTYVAVRVWLAVALVFGSGVLVYALRRPATEVLLAAGGGLVLALLAPELAVLRQARLRRKEIQRSLPDALDLMVVCVEAGVGLDQAILRVSDEFENAHPALAHEFRVINQRVNAGMPRTHALRELVARTGLDELRSLVATLIQSEKLGVPIARVLRVSSDGLRTRRRQAAEQAARKAPIKMLFPLVFFVLPALFIVLLGPAVMHVIRIMKEAAP